MPEQIFKQLAFPGIPHLGTGAPNICDRKQVERRQVAFVAYHGGKGGDNIRVGSVLLLGNGRHEQVLVNEPDNHFAVFRA